MHLSPWPFQRPDAPPTPIFQPSPHTHPQRLHLFCRPVLLPLHTAHVIRSGKRRRTENSRPNRHQSTLALIAIDARTFETFVHVSEFSRSDAVCKAENRATAGLGVGGWQLGTRCRGGEAGVRRSETGTRSPMSRVLLQRTLPVQAVSANQSTHGAFRVPTPDRDGATGSRGPRWGAPLTWRRGGQTSKPSSRCFRFCQSGMHRLNRR